MTESGMGHGVNAHHLTFFPVARLRNCKSLASFQRGQAPFAGVERVTMVFVGAGSS
jgi:hypothetical protein